MPDYNPNFPYRINGDPVNADSTGIVYPYGSDVLEVQVDRAGVTLRMNDEEAFLNPERLRILFHARKGH